MSIMAMTGRLRGTEGWCGEPGRLGFDPSVFDFVLRCDWQLGVNDYY